MRILITGGAGFVGSSLALHLRQTFSDAGVVCMDNLYRRGSELNLPRLQKAGIEFHRGDVRDVNGFPSGPFDYLIECSAEPSVLAGQDGAPDYLFQTNLVGAYNCLEKARGWTSRFIFLSTSRVYPIARIEAHPWREEATRFTWEHHGINGITPRGVTEQIKVDQGVAALWVLAHHFGAPLSYIGYGGMGKQVRDFLHVDDLCDLIAEQVKNFDRWDGWLGNVSGGVDNSASLCELTALCAEITGKKISISSVPANRPNDLRIFVADCARLFERTQWRPKRDVHRIIQDINDWVANHSAELEQL